MFGVGGRGTWWWWWRRTIGVEREEPVLLLLVRLYRDQVRLPLEAVLGAELLEEDLDFLAVGRVFCQEMDGLEDEDG